MEMFKTQYNKEIKLWSGRDVPPLYNPKISLAHVLLRSCVNYGSKIAQISDDSGIRLTYDEMRIKTIRAAQNLQKRGYNSKAVFGIVAKNSHHLAPIVFASLAIGSAVNGLDPLFNKTELLHVLNLTKPVLVFCDVACYDLVKLCLDKLENSAKIFTFGGIKNGSEQVENLFEETHEESDFLPVEVDDENEFAAIVCSSGTTGLPKGISLSHAALIESCDNLTMVNSNDALLSFNTLYWISGWVLLITGTMNGATRIITTATFSEELYLQLIEKYRITFAITTPFYLDLLLKSDQLNRIDLSSLKIQATAGSKCPKSFKQKMIDKLPNVKLCDMYGLSEVSGPFTANFDFNTDSAGQLRNSVSVKIIDENGNRCGIGEDGEVCVKTIYRSLGYYGNQKATDEILDEEGFLITGDIGHFDDNGNLYIIGRKKDLIRVGGRRISPALVELFLAESPDITAACIINIPGELMNDLLVAFVIRSDGSNITEEDVANMVADQFANNYKLTGGIKFVDSLPINSSGKLQRRKLRELFLHEQKQ